MCLLGQDSYLEKEILPDDKEELLALAGRIGLVSQLIKPGLHFRIDLFPGKLVQIRQCLINLCGKIRNQSIRWVVVWRRPSLSDVSNQFDERARLAFGEFWLEVG